MCNHVSSIQRVYLLPLPIAYYLYLDVVLSWLLFVVICSLFERNKCQLYHFELLAGKLDLYWQLCWLTWCLRAFEQFLFNSAHHNVSCTFETTTTNNSCSSFIEISLSYLCWILNVWKQKFRCFLFSSLDFFLFYKYQTSFRIKVELTNSFSPISKTQRKLKLNLKEKSHILVYIYIYTRINNNHYTKSKWII